MAARRGTNERPATAPRGPVAGAERALSQRSTLDLLESIVNDAMGGDLFSREDVERELRVDHRKPELVQLVTDQTSVVGMTEEKRLLAIGVAVRCLGKMDLSWAECRAIHNFLIRQTVKADTTRVRLLVPIDASWAGRGLYSAEVIDVLFQLLDTPDLDPHGRLSVLEAMKPLVQVDDLECQWPTETDPLWPTETDPPWGCFSALTA